MNVDRLLPAVSTPYPRLSPPTERADRKVVVAVTRGRIDRNYRAEFDRQTQRVVDAIAQQPGLLGYSVRRQVCGNTVWTLSVWESKDDLAHFIASPAHRCAIARSGVAVLTMQSWRKDVTVAQLPKSWDDLLATFV